MFIFIVVFITHHHHCRACLRGRMLVLQLHGSQWNDSMCIHFLTTFPYFMWCSLVYLYYIIAYCTLQSPIYRVRMCYVHIYYMYLACINLLFLFFFSVLHLNKTKKERIKWWARMMHSSKCTEAILSCTFDCVAMVTKTLQVSELRHNYFIYNFYPSFSLSLTIAHLSSHSVHSFHCCASCEAPRFERGIAHWILFANVYQ